MIHPKLKHAATDYMDSFLIASFETKQFAALSQLERFSLCKSVKSVAKFANIKFRVSHVCI
jgi:hypothetical protein